jgi:hypothetical protein
MLIGGVPEGYNHTGCSVGAIGEVDESVMCFAGSETVTLESGAALPISSVRVGDRVLAADAKGVLSFSPVIAVPHAENSIVATFIEISTATGKSIKMTPEHLVLAGACDQASSQMSLMRAADVTMGLCLRTVDGLEAVESTKVATATGIYTVVTMQEFLVVNGIVASPFAVNHAIPEAWYSIHRMLYAVLPAALGFKLFQQTSERFGDLSVQYSL